MLKIKTLLIAVTGSLIAFSSNASVQTLKVNGEVITKKAQNELIDAFIARGATRTPQLEERAKRILVREAVLKSISKKAKLENKPEVKKALENARNTILMNAVVSEWLKEHPVKEADVQALFETEKNRWGNTEVQVRHILVKEEKEANALFERLSKGESFESLAKAHSIDTQQNRDAGGLIEWTSPNVFDRDFAMNLNLLKAGETAKQPVKTSLGWHIIRLEGRRPAQRFANFEQHKQQLAQLLMQKSVQTYIDEEIKKAKITTIKSK